MLLCFNRMPMAKARTRTPDRADEARTGVLAAVAACDAKKAGDIALLEMEKNSGAFTDYFVICSGSNPRQIQAISDEVEERLRPAGLRPVNVEGYKQAEWVLLDYVDFVVHVFSEHARKYYALERLWKSAKKVEPAALRAPQKARRATASRRVRAARPRVAAPAKRRKTAAKSGRKRRPRR